MKTLTIVAGAIGTAAVAGTGLWLGAGPAGAVPDVVDRPFSDAKAMIQQAGGTAVVATRTGGGLDENECLVTNACDAPYQRIVRGGMTANNEVLVALNCNGVLAGPGVRQLRGESGRPSGKVRSGAAGTGARGAAARRGGHYERVACER